MTRPKSGQACSALVLLWLPIIFAQYPQEPLANVILYQNYEGIYFNFLGNVKTSHAGWNLVTYVDLSKYVLRYTELESLYNNTADICSTIIQNFENTDNSHTCQLFAQATLPYLYEIQTNHQTILSSIGPKIITVDRIRRGFGNTFKRLANVLYGISSNLDYELIFSKIIDFTSNKQTNIDLIKKNLRIFHTEISEANTTMNEIKENQQRFENNVKYLNEQVRQNTQEINELTIKSKLLEQSVLFETILNQYAYDTQNLIAIINSATTGKIHTSVIPINKWLTELREIKLMLPKGTHLPLDVTAESIPEFISISENTIFQKNHFLIFVVNILLISEDEYMLYRPIPLPIIYEKNSLILIETQIENLALSKNSERFLTLTNKQWETCKPLSHYTLCKGGQFLHHRSKSNLCELAILKRPQT